MNINGNDIDLYNLSITERLGRIYNNHEEYKKSIQNEQEIFEKLQESLTEKQLKIAVEYHTAANATISICERLAYRQGMRDFAAILYSEE